MRTAARFLVLFLLVPLTTLVAQVPESLRPGQRIRVTAPELGLNKRPATFETWRGDTLVFTAAARGFAPTVGVFFVGRMVLVAKTSYDHVTNHDQVPAAHSVELVLVRVV